MAKSVAEMQEEMKKNSAAWHGADKATQDKLHQDNINLQQQIDAANKTTTSFNSRWGTWGTASPAGQSPATSPAGGGNSGSGTSKQQSSFQGSATGVEVNTSEQQKIKDKMNANSQAWHTASPEEKARLEQENRDWAEKLGGSVGFNNGTWSGSAAGQKPSTGGDYSGYIEDMYAAKQKAALDALRAAYEKNVAGLDRAQAAIAPGYQSARNEAAAQAELQKKNFAEYAAANGLNSGAGGQAQLAFGNALQNNLSGIAQKEASTMADLELQRSQMETDYNSAIAQAEAQGDFELAQQLYAEKVRQDEQMLVQMQWQAQQDLAQKQLQFNKDQAAVGQQQWQQSFDKGNEQYNQQWALTMAQDMAQYGNFDGYKALGYSDSVIQAMRDKWNKETQGTAMTYGGGGGGTGTGKLTAAQALSAFMNGYDTDEIRAAIEPLYGRLWKEPAPAGSGGTSGGMDGGSFSGLVSRIQSMIRTGSKDDAAALFASNSGRLSDSQVGYLKQILGIG